MLHTLAISNYRSILELVVGLGALNVVSGPNGAGKSNLYRALRLLAQTASGGGVVGALAREGGLDSSFWAGPEVVSAGMKTGAVPVERAVRQKVQRLRLGFAGDDFGYSISLGLPPQGPGDSSWFGRDPEIKRECIWAGPYYRRAAALVDREGPIVKHRQGRTWAVVPEPVPTYDSLFAHVADPSATPEVFHLRDRIQRFRFYDHFRTDRGAPARQPQLGTRTPVMHHDGRDVAAALRTIEEVGDVDALRDTIGDAFPGAVLRADTLGDGLFGLSFTQHGLLRALSGAELSDGTLRYILWVVALLTPRPPEVMVLNEPETSLHPDLIPALGRLIRRAAERSQLWVITHSAALMHALDQAEDVRHIALQKTLGQTEVVGQRLLDMPAWYWPDAA
ncbi:MAG: AAA family ATPase [Sandaracinaceae bacterium]|nr:AAA family ATPase [Sandaracinaceae bacterium]MBK8587596.1 AAA family ATPase [Sandaracinaceae bacterium]